MSTVVCQRLQSCLESQLVETRTLRLIVASPKVPHLEKTQTLCVGHDDKYTSSSNSDFGGWSSLQTLYNTSQSPKQDLDRESSYVPPLQLNQPSFKLSDKSLDMCTENLGSETGTDIAESSSFSLSESDEESRNSPAREQLKSRQQQHVESSKKVINSRKFPPPLTTMSGLQVRSHREGGRLVIEAVETPSRPSCFQAERSHGRLRLCFLKDCSATATSYLEVATEENDESGIEEQVEEEFEEQEGEAESDAYVLREDMDGSSFDVGVEKGIKKFQWPSRCKEGGRGLSTGRLCNWEPLCVATP
ncbi:protein FANTASTIC FOUR 3-like [Cornus florida]|uniref:protein FANTASTIC FOUR 3-like n=1 Tax=Cornus florida TaxID=4283 RepID=UPI0028993DDF|nr:protein FANTASTIC FOUR 3-like [Cornus florida]